MQNGGMGTVVRRANGADLAPAHAVWEAANVARGMRPSAQRIERVHQKLAEQNAVLLVADRDDEVIGMLLAEQGRSDHDPAIADLGHISMVFVRPDCQGQGVGHALLEGLGPVADEHGWRRLSLWTRRSNLRARSLYEKDGFAITGETKNLGEADAVDRWQRDL
jgi:ribosomal protein S18 acetylase RimI-like enzyme